MLLLTARGTVYVSCVACQMNSCLYSMHFNIPLIVGMARMCCDGPHTVRQTAITYLQRALLAHELQVLTAGECMASLLPRGERVGCMPTIALNNVGNIYQIIIVLSMV